MRSVFPIVMESAAPAAAASSPASLPPGSNPPVADDTPIQLHPLVVVNISDHVTRLATLTAVEAARGGGDGRSSGGSTGGGGASGRARGGRSSSGGPAAAVAAGAVAGGGGTDGTRAYGVLLGRQPGRVVEVCHSFEVPMITEAGGPGGGVAGRQTLDPVFLAGRIEQYKQVFPALSVVGWYVSGGWIGEEDAAIHSVRDRRVMTPCVVVVAHVACIVVFCLLGFGGRASDSGRWGYSWAKVLWRGPWKDCRRWKSTAKWRAMPTSTWRMRPTASDYEPY